MTYLLNLSLLTHKNLEEPVLAWINDQLVPAITDPERGFDKFEVFRLISPVDRDNLTITVQIRSTNRKKLEGWFIELASPICDEIFQKYADEKGNSQVIPFPSILESIG